MTNCVSACKHCRYYYWSKSDGAGKEMWEAKLECVCVILSFCTDKMSRFSVLFGDASVSERAKQICTRLQSPVILCLNCTV